MQLFSLGRHLSFELWPPVHFRSHAYKNKIIKYTNIYFVPHCNCERPCCIHWQTPCKLHHWCNKRDRKYEGRLSGIASNQSVRSNKPSMKKSLENLDFTKKHCKWIIIDAKLTVSIVNRESHMQKSPPKPLSFPETYSFCIICL